MAMFGFALLFLLGIIQRSFAIYDNNNKQIKYTLNQRPARFGHLFVLTLLIFSVGILSGILLQDILRVAPFITITAAWLVCYRYINAQCKAQGILDIIIINFLRFSAIIATLTTLAIIFSLTFEAINFFKIISPIDFMFGTHWSPQLALREDQVGSSGSFGIIPLLVGTIMMTIIALSIAIPVGLFCAVFLSQYASYRQRLWIKPLLEILSGIPTVVYGFFAVSIIAPIVRNAGEAVGLEIMTESALIAGSVMGVMIIPLVSSLCDDVLSAVPKSLKEGALGLGATSHEMITQVIFPAASPGIISAFILAFSRAIGETMIVVMAAGIAANLTINPLDPVTTVTVQIVKLLVGDQEFDSPKTLSAYALGFVLFFTTLTLNIIAMRRIQKYRKRYE